MTSSHHHSHSVSVPHEHGHSHAHGHRVSAKASWLLHSAGWRGLWALLVCAGVLGALVWAMAAQG